MISIVALLGTITHVGYLLVFYLLDIMPLAIFNVGSILMWVLAWRLNKRGESFQAFLLASVEVVSHAIFACYIVGWELGFQYFLFAIIPFTMFNNRYGAKVIVLIISSLCLIYMALYFKFRFNSAIQINNEITQWLFYSNCLVAFFALGLSSYYFRFAAKRSIEKVSILANTDHLTGLCNRRNLFSQVHQLAQENDEEFFSLIICDIDDFKQINDKFGHTIGDQVIKNVAECLKEGLRHNELVARWGGEEFLIVLPEINIEQARKVANRIKSNISEMSVQSKGELIKVTLTYGIAQYCRGDNLEKTIRWADEKLYQGKRSGKNKVVI